MGTKDILHPSQVRAGLPRLGHVCYFWMHSMQTALQNLTL